MVDQSATTTLNQTCARHFYFVTYGLILGAFLGTADQKADREEIACKVVGPPVGEFKINLGGK